MQYCKCIDDLQTVQDGNYQYEKITIRFISNICSFILNIISIVSNIIPLILNISSLILNISSLILNISPIILNISSIILIKYKYNYFKYKFNYFKYKSNYFKYKSNYFKYKFNYLKYKSTYFKYKSTYFKYKSNYFKYKSNNCFKLKVKRCSVYFTFILYYSKKIKLLLAIRKLDTVLLSIITRRYFSPIEITESVTRNIQIYKHTTVFIIVDINIIQYCANSFWRFDGLSQFLSYNVIK